MIVRNPAPERSRVPTRRICGEILNPLRPSSSNCTDMVKDGVITKLLVPFIVTNAERTELTAIVKELVPARDKIPRRVIEGVMLSVPSPERERDAVFCPLTSAVILRVPDPEKVTAVNRRTDGVMLSVPVPAIVTWTWEPTVPATVREPEPLSVST